MNLPKAELDRYKAMELWKTTRSEYAKEQVVLSNQALVASVLWSMNLNVFDEDLFATGLVGLVKAVNRFDADKGISFSTFSVYVIKNEILMTFRKKRVDVAFSLDETEDMGDGEISYNNMLSDDTDIEEIVLTKLIIDKAYSGLKDREKTVFDLAYKQGKTQMEIADAIGISQAQVSRILTRISEKFRKETEETT